MTMPTTSNVQASSMADAIKHSAQIGKPAVTATKKKVVANPEDAAKTTMPANGNANNNISQTANHDGSLHDNRSRKPNPVSVAFERKMNEIEERIARLKNRMEDVIGGTSGSEGAEAKTLRASLLADVRRVREEIRKLEEEKKALIGEQNEAKEQAKKKAADVSAAKEKLPAKSVAEIDGKIKELDKKLESGQFPLNEEKQMVQDISRLKKVRKQLEALEGRGIENSIGKPRFEMIRGRLDEKNSLIAKLREQANGLSIRINELDKKRQETSAQRTSRQAEIDKLRAQINEQYEARRSAYSEMKEAKRVQHEAFLRRQVKLAEFRRRDELQAQIDALEDQLAVMNPATKFHDQWSACATLAAYFEPYAFKEEKMSATTTQSSFVSVESVEAPVKELVPREPTKLEGDWASAEALPPKSVRNDEECYFANVVASKGKGKKKHASASSTTTNDQALGKLPLQILAGLADLNLSPPTTIEQARELYVILGRQREELVAAKQASMGCLSDEQKTLSERIQKLKNELEKPLTAADLAKDDVGKEITTVSDNQAEAEKQEEVKAE